MLDYTNYDYQALVDRMTEILKDKDGWGDAYQSSTGQTLIQLMADVTDHLHYMLERRTLESFLDTAKLRSSIVARASDLGYRPERIKSHTGTLEVTLLDEFGEPTPALGEVNLAAMKGLTYDGRNFYVSEPAYVREGQTTATFKIKEGDLKIKTFDLDAGEEPLFAEYDNIEEDVFFVYNNGIEYKDVRKASDVNKRALSFLQPNEAYFDIKYGVEGMRIEFGDDEFGKKPTGVISVYYAEVPQVGEPILSNENEFVFNDKLTDYQIPGIEYESVVKNITPIVGGAEPESLERIKVNAATYHRSNGRAVTNEDYSFWMKRSGISNIVDAKAFGEEEFDSLVYNANNVYITYATSTGAALTAQEKQDLIDYFDNVKTSQAHVVFNQARNIFLRLNAEVVRYKDVPISIAQAYSIIYNFIVNYMRIREGSIGNFFHLSDLTAALYNLKFSRHGVSYSLVDYVKLSSDVVLPFDFPAKTNECFVEIDPTYVPVDGDEFVINLENVVCRSTISDTDNFKDILSGMRDVIMAITPFDATVQLSGVALDVFGNPIPIEIDPKVGYHLLIGVDTPYLSKDELFQPATIGSSIIGVAVESPELEINHFYYACRAGRRPMIPLRVGTEILFTAPTDTNVKVYVRTNAKDPSTETFFGDLLAGETFNETFTDDHVLIFEYVNDSDEDVIANIKYPTFVGVKYGLRIRAIDNFGTFSINTKTGDLQNFVSVDYRIQLPVNDYYSTTSENAVLPGTLRLCDTQGNIIYQDDSEGRFFDVNGNLIPSGRVDYKAGFVTLPKDMPPTTPLGKYLLIYDQDRFENVRVGSGEVINLLPPPPSPDSTSFSLSSLKVG